MNLMGRLGTIPSTPMMRMGTEPIMSAMVPMGQRISGLITPMTSPGIGSDGELGSPEKDRHLYPI